MFHQLILLMIHKNEPVPSFFARRQELRHLLFFGLMEFVGVSFAGALLPEDLPFQQQLLKSSVLNLQFHVNAFQVQKIFVHLRLNILRHQGVLQLVFGLLMEAPPNVS